jgi:hypothetical protein
MVCEECGQTAGPLRASVASTFPLGGAGRIGQDGGMQTFGFLIVALYSLGLAQVGALSAEELGAGVLLQAFAWVVGLAVSFVPFVRTLALFACLLLVATWWAAALIAIGAAFLHSLGFTLCAKRHSAS